MLLKPITNPELFNAVLAAGKNNSHDLVAPNIVVLDNKQEIIGAVSSLPMHLIWMDTVKAKVRDSIKLKETLESSVALSGGRMLCLPCSVNSPYHSLLSKDGYKSIGSFDVLIKVL